MVSDRERLDRVRYRCEHDTVLNALYKEDLQFIFELAYASFPKDQVSSNELPSWYRQGYTDAKADKVTDPDKFDPSAHVSSYHEYYNGALDAQIEIAFSEFLNDFKLWSNRDEVNSNQVVSILSGIKLMFVLNGISGK